MLETLLQSKNVFIVTVSSEKDRASLQEELTAKFTAYVEFEEPKRRMMYRCFIKTTVSAPWKAWLTRSPPGKGEVDPTRSCHYSTMHCSALCCPMPDMGCSW